MIQKNQAFPKLMNMLSDVLIILLSYFAAVHLRFDVLDGVVTVSHTSGRVLGIVIAYSVLITFVFFCFNVYDHRHFRRNSRTIRVLAVNFVGVLALTAVFFALRIVDFSRWTLAFFWAISSLLVILKHKLIRVIASRKHASGRNQLHVAVVGNGHLAYQCIQDLAADPELGVVVDGYISAAEKPDLGRCLGRYEDLERILYDWRPDCLIVALEAHETQFMRDVLMAAEKEGTRVELIPFYNDYFPTHPSVEVVGQTKMINLRSTPLDSIGWAFAKRAMDVVGSLLLIALTSPIMLVAAIGVKLSSPGPVLFRQERVGVNKEPFMMLKFRSMRTDIDHTGWTTDADPRKTKFGSFLRKFSIDELPQLFNVLRGQMSLVGPRPEIPRYVRRFRDEVPLYLVRQQVRPGMTGWAQIHGLRGDTSIEARVEYDIWYIENWSLGLDIRILLKTVFGGFMNTEKLTVPDRKTEETSSAAR